MFRPNWPSLGVQVVMMKESAAHCNVVPKYSNFNRVIGLKPDRFTHVHDDTFLVSVCGTTFQSSAKHFPSLQIKHILLYGIAYASSIHIHMTGDM
jgi:hypothetical protein